MTEKDPKQSLERSAERSAEQRRDDYEQQERLRNDLERRAEQPAANPEREAEAERLTAERLAESTERPSVDETIEKRADKPNLAPSSKQQRADAYRAIMTDTQAQMAPLQRGFSKLIHNRAIETTSTAVGATVARPNAILAGSFTAFVAVLAIFLIARYYGYPLSGSETMAAFAAGWVLGVVFDYVRALMTGRR